MGSSKYIGMDVHKESISIAVRNAVGKVVMECVIETKASMILQFYHLLASLDLRCELPPSLPLSARTGRAFRSGWIQRPSRRQACGSGDFGNSLSGSSCVHLRRGTRCSVPGAPYLPAFLSARSLPRIHCQVQQRFLSGHDFFHTLFRQFSQ